MNIEEFRAYCLSKPGVAECMSFDPEIWVCKVVGKMFALAPLDNSFSINLKCEREKAESLRERYNCVEPGYHMNKKMWITVTIDGSVTDEVLKQWIDHSYDEVVKKMSRKQQDELKVL